MKRELRKTPGEPSRELEGEPRLELQGSLERARGEPRGSRA